MEAQEVIDNRQTGSLLYRDPLSKRVETDSPIQ